jgi:lipid-binding SYLF domain-containing protein
MKMRNFMKRCAAGAIGLALTFGLAANTGLAQDKKAAKEQMKEARTEISEATKVLNTMMKKPDDFIPRELLEKAEAVVIIPDVIKAGFIVGGRGGDGVVSRKLKDGSWSVPVFYDMGGASVGAQIGVKRTDFIMLFMNEGSLRDLLDENFEFGVGASFAAGPVGRTVGAGTNPTLDVGVLTYSMSEGAFVGAAIKGAVLTADNSLNEAIYGMSAKEILANPETVKMTGLSKEIKNFSDTVARYAGKK